MAGKILIIIACCKSKRNDEGLGCRWENKDSAVSRLSPKHANALLACRRELAEKYGCDEGKDLGGSREATVPMMPAYKRYAGHLYGEIDPALWGKLKGRGDCVEVLIVSALYGLLTPWEAIRKYELSMATAYAERYRLSRWWRDKGLGEMLYEFVRSSGASIVHDFLSGKYREITRELKAEAGSNFRLQPHSYPGLGSGSDCHRGKGVRDLLEGALCREPMPPPNNSRLPPDVWICRLPGGDLDISPALADLLVTSRNNYDWPEGTGARESQNVIIELEREVEDLVRGLDPARSHQIIKKVSSWGGNNANAQRRIDEASREDQVRMRDAIRHVLNPLTLKRGLDELSKLPGLRLVMATKIFRFCCPSWGAAVDRHASYFFNSLQIVAPNGICGQSTDFRREWSNGEHTSSRLAIYSSAGHSLNLREFVDVYLPLVTQIAESLNILGATYRCAGTGVNKNWRPADVEMAAYYWWAREGSR